MPRAALLSLVAALCLALTLLVFFGWTYPANVATGHWTQASETWQALRSAWEYSHAANAVISFAALCAASVSALWMEPTAASRA